MKKTGQGSALSVIAVKKRKIELEPLKTQFLSVHFEGEISVVSVTNKYSEVFPFPAKEHLLAREMQWVPWWNYGTPPPPVAEIASHHVELPTCEKNVDELHAANS